MHVQQRRASVQNQLPGMQKRFETALLEGRRPSYAALEGSIRDTYETTNQRMLGKLKDQLKQQKRDEILQRGLNRLNNKSAIDQKVMNERKNAKATFDSDFEVNSI